MLLEKFTYLIHAHSNLCDSVHSQNDRDIWQEAFQYFFNNKAPDLFETYDDFWNTKRIFPPKEQSVLWVEVAKILEEFLCFILDIKGYHHPLFQKKKTAHDLSLLHKIRRDFIQRRVLLGQSLKDFCEESPYKGSIPPQDIPFLNTCVNDQDFDLHFSEYVNHLLSDEKQYEREIHVVKEYIHFALTHPLGQRRHAHSTLFHPPQPITYDDLVKVPKNPSFHRDGFAFDNTVPLKETAYTESHYCLHCHKNEKDSCAKGMLLKNSDQTPIPYAKNPLEVDLVGCPLRQKISEMHMLFSQGYTLSALAMAMMDNPLIPATGHRICNDCMKSCIFQKQDPVDTPGVETHILQEILSYDYGVDLYLLLTRWNPFCMDSLEKNFTPKRILVVGSGPAGFGISYYLLKKGHHVFMIEGARIDSIPLPWPYRGEKLPKWSVLCNVYNTSTERGGDAFGGVMRYGITARWNKDYLLLIRLVLERFDHFSIMGDVRFGGAITSNTAFHPLDKEENAPSLHMDHIALCMGSGKPNIHPSIPLARGVHYASDFLMALQLEGAFEKESTINFDIELPAIVMGGGLTSIDTAVEILAYYPRYVEKIAKSVERNSHDQDNNSYLREKTQRLLSHHAALENERQQAKKEKRAVDFYPLLKKWGGITLLYRGSLKKAPAYRLNHEEVQHALNHGVHILEDMHILDVVTNAYNDITHINVVNKQGQCTDIVARTLILSTGTAPNTNLLKDEPDLFSFGLDARGFPHLQEKFILHKRGDGRFMTVFGDMNPSYHGSVVKALASAKEGASVVEKSLQQITSTGDMALPSVQDLKTLVQPHIQKIIHHSNGMAELVVKAPFAAHHTHPGQFFKCQFPKNSLTEKKKYPPLILSAYDIDKIQGTLSLMVLNKGIAAHLLQTFTPGDPFFLMGPNGAPSHIPHQKNVVLMGQGFGNIVLSPIVQDMKAAGCTITYIASYPHKKDILDIKTLQKSCDHLYICLEQDEGGDTFPDAAHVTWGKGSLHDAVLWVYKTSPHLFQSTEYLLVIAAPHTLQDIQTLFMNDLKDCFPSDILMEGSFTSPMQCMLKGVCARCVQWVIDPYTQQKKPVFTCEQQDHPLFSMDLDAFHMRLGQHKPLI